ncbi:hypothetical protein [Opitutus sp. ER46]|uniref:hypothetical protein n=1 Tax=Opitutus sp. ER46 TaxID=2161864 RepID=UPI000D2F4CBC|nr:hypothetical protein [Opitutus sp. ER46]PTX92449.1 hypothetical protein DB354_14030 [Opitutus sp. ER46]
MKLKNFGKIGLLLAAVLALAGCNTFESRAREKAQVYERLPVDTRQRLQQGQISIGDSPDMVYIALGYPDERRETRTLQGEQTLWIYRTYWQQYEGRAWVGWRRVIIPVRGGRGYMVVHEPVTTDVYSTHADDTIRVTFERGAVVAVEQRRS